MRMVAEDPVRPDELTPVPGDLAHRAAARVVEDHRRRELRLDEQVEDSLHRLAAAICDRLAEDDDPLRPERPELVLPPR